MMKMTRVILAAALAWLVCAGPALGADVPFSTYVLGLAAASSISGTEKLVAVQGGVPKTMTPAQIMSAMNGDCSIASPPTIICTKTNGSNFAASATTDTTSASNIVSGTLNTARLPAPFANGTRQGNTLAYLTFAGGAPTTGHIATFDANGNLQDGGTAATVSSVIPGGGIVSSTTAACSQSAITATGTLSKAECPNAQTGTSYAIVDGDRGKLITANNTAAQAYTIAQAGASSSFVTGWLADVQNINAPSNPAGVVTITPTTSTICGNATLKIYPGQGARIVSDGTNYQCIPYSMGGGGWVLLNTLTASNSATLSDTTSLTSAFTEYEIAFENILAATSGQTCGIQLHSGGSFQSTGYLATTVGIKGSVTGSSQPTTFLPCTNAADSGNTVAGIVGSFRIVTLSASAFHVMTGSFSYPNNSGTVTVGTMGGYWNTSAAIDGFQVSFASGNITSGTIKIYARL